MIFASSETGAVTVDWVVLAAGLVGLGLATMAVVSSGVQDTSQDIDAGLSSSVVTTHFRGSVSHVLSETGLNGCAEDPEAAIRAFGEDFGPALANEVGNPGFNFEADGAGFTEDFLSRKYNAVGGKTAEQYQAYFDGRESAQGIDMDAELGDQMDQYMDWIISQRTDSGGPAYTNVGLYFMHACYAEAL